MDKEPDIVDRLIAAQLPICFEAAQLITWIRQERDEARKERDEAREFVQEFVNYADRFASRPRAAVTYNDLVDFIQSNLDDANKFLKKNTDG